MMLNSTVRGKPQAGRSTRSPRQRVLLLALILIGVLAAAYFASGALGQWGDGPNAVRPMERRALGPADARAQIVVYFDFQCPHCDSLRAGAEAQIIEKYVKTNQAHLEVRPFAVMGPDSVRASEAALCAADQGRFWEYRDALFKSYRQSGRTAYLEDGLVRTASATGLDVTALRTCLTGQQRRPEVDQILSQGKADGVQAVPTVLINGQKLEGALPFESFATVIERSLAK
jgi:protein-disulfide isomerase